MASSQLGKPMKINATYTSVFDNDVVCTSGCLYDADTKVVSDIQIADNSADADDANARTDEYVTLPDGTQLRDTDGVQFDY